MCFKVYNVKHGWLFSIEFLVTILKLTHNLYVGLFFTTLKKIL